MNKKIFLLGSTGSIGVSTLDVIRQHPENFTVSCLVANRNIDTLAQQVAEFRPSAAVIYDDNAYTVFRDKYDFPEVKIFTGKSGLQQALEYCESNVFLNAFVGFSGLEPTVRAIEMGLDIAIANKETLVVAGELITNLAKEKGANLLPVDSEHSAIWQCLLGEDSLSVTRIILTASGGPFRGWPQEKLNGVTPEQALKHPNWKMGAKITIDSATLMNKGLEVIEAYWLYPVTEKQIEVVIHPQSIIHSMVEFSDHSIKAQLGIPDMRIPIQYALTFPERLPLDVAPMNFYNQGALTFEQPDFERFPCLKLAYDVLKKGGTYPAVLNAANEIAVDAFLKEKIRFTQIPQIVADSLDGHQSTEVKSVAMLFELDREIREQVEKNIRLKQK